jgi:TrmH family RNA methyltransferase
VTLKVDEDKEPLCFMLTKNEIKQLKQLQLKKFRKQDGLYLAEGVKLVEELLRSNHKIRAVYCTKEFTQQFPQAAVLKADVMKQISTMTTPPGVIAVAEIPKPGNLNLLKGWTLALNDINDPGNLGTMLRTADWFGISQVICSENCVDSYSPKVVQASMGAVFRVSVHYLNMPAVLTESNKQQVNIYAADMKGESLNSIVFPKTGILVMGSESHGISSEIRPLVNHWVNIPGKGKTESLNVSVAAGIICSRLPL